MPHSDTALSELDSDDFPNITRAQQDQAFRGESDLFDRSGALFSMYLDRASEEDKKMVESWDGDAKGMLIFTGLFSAVVAVLLSAFCLAHIYQQLSTQPNGSHTSIPSSPSNPIEPYTPPTSAVWVNGLWSMSLVISLTCTILATLVKQWARRYLIVAYPRCCPRKKARIRAFYKHGVEKLHIHWAIEVLSALLHISLFLFFAGLSVVLFGVHPTIFKTVTAWIVLCVILYGCITFLPIIRKDSPYSSPFSAPVYHCLTGIRHLFFQLLRKFPDIETTICTPLRSNDPGHSMSKRAEEFALKLPPNIDHRSLLWTFESLDEDTDLEKYFEGLASLCGSETGEGLNLQEGFIVPHTTRLSSALIGLMNRTLSSNLVPEFVKQRRMIICTKVVEMTSLLGPWWFLRCVVVGEWYRFLECIEFGLFVQNWKNISHPVTSFYAQCVAALTISIVRDYDERWFQLASGLLDAPKSLLNDYIAHGDSILLANAIFIARRTVQTYSGSAERHRKEVLCSSSRTLKMVCKLEIGGTLPELQHRFCGLWNQLVRTARTDERPHHVSVATITLKNIRQLYIDLHGRSGTPTTAFYTTTDDQILDDPWLYPMCRIDSHRPSLVPDLQFDEPPPDADPTPLPNFVMPAHTFPYLPVTFSIIHPSSLLAPYPILPVPSHHGAPFEDEHFYLAAPPLVARTPFHVPPLTRRHAPSVPSGGNSQSQPRP